MRNICQRQGKVTEEIRKWFSDVEELLGPQNVNVCNNPIRVFNVYKTAIYINPDRGLGIGKRGKSTYQVGENNKENSTMMMTVRADVNTLHHKCRNHGSLILHQKAG